MEPNTPRARGLGLGVWSCVCAHVRVCACRDVNVGRHPLSLLTLASRTLPEHEILQFSQVGWATIEPQRSVCLCLAPTGITGACGSQRFVWV